jgi:uncharacterized protein (TIGR02186 family)
MQTYRHILALAAALIAVLAVIYAGLIVGSGPATAERIVASLSRHRVQVTSSFTGTQIVLFGSIERDPPPAVQRTNYDIVVTVMGPRQTIVTRRKGRVLGIWANVDSRAFINVPTYLSVLTNRPVNSIANAETTRRLQVGLENIVLPQQIGPDIADSVRDDPFRKNFVKLQVDHKLYSEETNGVTFLTPTLFRSDIALPAVAPFGNYDVEVKLFSEGNMVTRMTSAFELVKFGFEQQLADAARNHGTLYGLSVVAMALGTGWFASIVFRRD